MPALRPRTFVLSWVDDEPPVPEPKANRKFCPLAPSLIEELVRTIYRVAGADIEVTRRTLAPPALHVFDHMDPIRC